MGFKKHLKNIVMSFNMLLIFFTTYTVKLSLSCNEN